MNERAILSLISDLYQQVAAYQARIVELEEQLNERRFDRAEDRSPAEADAASRND